ncbi:MAG: iron ABC transporter permease [Lentisphaerae bacterium]|jgi:iron complex transport system permease protein|nr:iron ABC transporter permease [Lentisphaerota bacterium]
MAKPAKSSLIFFAILLAVPICLALGILTGVGSFGLPDWQSAAGKGIIVLRTGRVLVGFLVGAALASSGLVLQAILRNPLADPYVLGVSSGAALGAALAILTGLGALVLSVGAFIFAISTILLVFLLGSFGGRITVYGLLLSGVIISSICSSLLMLLISLAPGEGLRTITWWMLGNLEAVSAKSLSISATLIILGFLGVWSMARQLNALTLGETMAHHLGVRTGFHIKVGLALAALMTASAVSLAGIIGFIGLIVPHAARAIIGADHRRLIPITALCGGMFLVLCDASSRLLFGTISIPAGVITALIGGPFFLMLLRRKRKHTWIKA